MLTNRNELRDRSALWQGLEVARWQHGETGLGLAKTSSGRNGAVDLEFGIYLADFWLRDRSQRRENGRQKPGDRFSGPGDHSGPILGHFRRSRARPLI